jgi:myo-inositol-1(or 4)-monophosphatase
LKRLLPSDLDNRLRVAEAVVREAGRVAADHFARRELLSIDRKGAQDLVSEADRACEDLIVAGLARLFPEDGFLGEERGSRNPDAAAVWVIDPIDGTHNFLTGIPFWCVSVGMVVGGELVLGIIYQPLAGELYSARSGGGAFLNGQPIKVSGETDLTRARVCVGFSYRRTVAAHARTVETLLSVGCEYLRLGSGALGLAYRAAGRFNG